MASEASRIGSGETLLKQDTVCWHQPVFRRNGAARLRGAADATLAYLSFSIKGVLTGVSASAWNDGERKRHFELSRSSPGLELVS